MLCATVHSPITLLAEALQRGQLLPWALRAEDPLPKAWRRCEDGLTMATIAAHLSPRAFGKTLETLAMELPLNTVPDSRPVIRGLHGVVATLSFLGPEGAVRELQALQTKLLPEQRSDLNGQLRELCLRVIPELRSADIVQAVSAR